jgi:hypothetical protein
MAVTGCRYRSRGLFFHLLYDQRSVRTNGNAPWSISIATTVALDGFAAQGILSDGTIRADKSAGAAANALLFVDDNQPGGAVSVHCACEARIDAGRVVAVLASDRQRLDFPVLDAYAADSRRLPPLQNLGDVIAPSLVGLAVDTAQTAPDTELLPNKHASHQVLRDYAQTVATGHR